METILKIENIEKYYGNKSNITKAIDNISFSVEKGEYVAIMGASGSGKTTLLNCISTIDRVSSGHIYVGRDDITKLRGNQLNRFRWISLHKIRNCLGFFLTDPLKCSFWFLPSDLQFSFLCLLINQRIQISKQLSDSLIFHL